MRLTSDADAAARSDDELRALQRESDDAITRVRAAWALAARLGASAITARDPGSGLSVGVRQHLLGVLERQHELATIVTIGRDDPDARLRATACALLAKHAGEERAAVQVLVDRLAHERDGAVLRALVEALPERAPPLIEAGCDALLARGDADADLRFAVLERRIAQGGPLLALELHESLAQHGADVRGRALETWIARAGAPAVLRAVESAPVAIVADALARVKGGVSWDDVAAIAARNLPALDALLLPYATPSDRRAISFLVAVVARGLDPGSRVFESPELRRSLIERALQVLGPVLDRPIDPALVPVLSVLLELVERVVPQMDADRLAQDEHALAGIAGALRHRLGAPGPHGWMGALRRVRDPSPRTIVEHTKPDGTSSIVITATSGLELRAPAHAVREIARALPEPAMAAEVERLGRDARTRFLDPDALDAALSRAVPPHPALAQDLGQLARIAGARGAPLRADFEEGWWDPAEEPQDRATMVELVGEELSSTRRGRG
ncbi:hypothetical protein [Sandaracinus amylolyticus]|nr:hypothetical protein [Sandaracinus amylolyticus]